MRNRTRELLTVTFAMEVLLACVVLVVLARQILPGRFFIDADYIHRLAAGRDYAEGSFQVTANLYAALGLQDNPLLAGLLGYAVAVLCAGIVVARCRQLRAGLPVLVLIACTALFSSVYLASYSKEVFSLGIVLLVLLLRQGWRAEACIVAAMALYAHEFRPYWYVVLTGYVALRLLLRKPRRFRTIVAWLTIAVAVASLGIWYVLGVPPNYYRLSANLGRSGAPDASTMILPTVHWADPLGGVVNNVVALWKLAVPVPLALLGGAYYLILAVLIGLIWFWLLRGMVRVQGREVPVSVRRSVALLLAFLTAQALFEPDYGSALRHLTPLLPLMLMVVWTAQPLCRVGARAGNGVVGSRVGDRAAVGVVPE